MPIRVVHLVRPADGGMRQHVRELIWGFPPETVAATVISAEGSKLADQLPDWVPIKTLPMQGKLRPLLDMRAVLSLRDFLNHESVDILHMHGARSAILGRAAALLARRQPSLICTVHNFIEPANPHLEKVYFQIEQRLSTLTDRYIAVSQALSNQLREKWAISPAKISTVYNGISSPRGQLSRRDVRKRFAIPTDAFVFGTIARLIPEKGLADLLQAWRLLQRRGSTGWLVIIGDGPERDDLQVLAADVADRIRWIGAVDNACEYLPGFDVYVQSSRKEGFGLAVLEAMQTGIPVVATRTGGLPEVVGEDGITGLLVPREDPLSLSLQMAELMSNEVRRKALGEAGKQRVQANFSIDHMVQQTLRIYQEVLFDKEGLT